jgi:TM2 domain-containing membrane protein YozV
MKLLGIFCVIFFCISVVIQNIKAEIKLKSLRLESFTNYTNTIHFNRTEKKIKSEMKFENSLKVDNFKIKSEFQQMPERQYYTYNQFWKNKNNTRSLYYVTNIECSIKNCPMPSFCFDNKTCKCGEGRVNFNSPDEVVQTYCHYRQKRQIVALLLETFISLGVGHFYARRTTHGIYKLCTGLIPCLISIFLCCYNFVHKQEDGEGLKMILLTVMCSFICLFIVVHLYDVLMFLTNSYTDGNGIPLLGL